MKVTTARLSMRIESLLQYMDLASRMFSVLSTQVYSKQMLK